MEKSADVETAGRGEEKVSWFRIVRHQGLVTDQILNWHYPGSGTDEDPYVVSWIDNDPRNPMNFAHWVKWALTFLVAIATLAVAFVSSAYSGGVREILQEFHVSEYVGILGVSLFVLGFAIGPLIWAPLSELFGRQILFFGTYAGLTAFNAGAAGSQNIQTLIIMRFFAGAIGSSPLTNAGGVIADMFTATERGLATTFFAAAPFLVRRRPSRLTNRLLTCPGPRPRTHRRWLCRRDCRLALDRGRHGHLHRRSLDRWQSPHPRDIWSRHPSSPCRQTVQDDR